MTPNCDWPISTEFDPSTVTVVSGEDALFDETIAVATDAPGGTYLRKDWALPNGEPMRNDRGHRLDSAVHSSIGASSLRSLFFLRFSRITHSTSGSSFVIHAPSAGIPSFGSAATATLQQ